MPPSSHPDQPSLFRPLAAVAILLGLAGAPIAAAAPAPVVTTTAVANAFAPATNAPALPARPEQLAFPPLRFDPPEREKFRRTLPNATAVYLAPSHELPLVTLTFTFRGGAYLDPEELPGLTALTAQLLREGGTQRLPPEQFDETLDFLAATVSAGADAFFTTVTLNCLTNHLDTSLTLLLEMLRTPAFDPRRLDQAKARMIEGLKQRNDDAATLLARAWQRLLYGDHHFAGREPTERSVARLTRDRLVALHRQLYHPGNLIVAASGDFDESALLTRLAQGLAGWELGASLPEPPAPSHVLTPGLYHVAKAVPQGKVAIGMRSITRDDPDAIALQLLNNILGGGGFTSRLMRQVRVQEGLTYSIRSTLAPEVAYPGEFRAGFASKNATVGRAARLVLEQIRDLRENLVTPEELAIAQQYAIETFPRQFESRAQTLQTFVQDEWTHRPAGYWQTYRDKVRAVTREELQRVARKHLDPDQMAILVVGDWPAMTAGTNDFPGGPVRHLPWRDPLTLEPLTGP